MTQSLMTTRRFAPLFWCQFFSAFNDNYLKTSVLFVITFQVASGATGPLSQLAGAALIAPFFLLSAFGGEMADRYDKALVARRLKFVEIFVTAIGVAGFAFHSLSLLFVALISFGIIAALFGPIKYGILPDHLAAEELPAGNALVEGGTFLAVLAGTILAGVTAAEGGNAATLGILTIGLSVLGWLAARMIPSTGEAAPDLRVNPNILASTWIEVRALYSEKRLFWLGLVISWFWLIGAVVLTLIPEFVTGTLGGTESVVTLFSTIFAVGIGLGSGLAAILSRQRIIILLTPIAGLLIGLFALDLGMATIGHIAVSPRETALAFLATGFGLHVAIDLFGLAACGGLYVVPAFAQLQASVDPERRARAVAAVNILNALFMTGGALGAATIQAAGVTTPGLLLIIGALAVIASIVIFRTSPGKGLPDVISLIYRLLFRVEIVGTENLALIAGRNAVIAPNHLSFLDAPLVLASIDCDPVFAIDVAISQRWWIKPFLKMSRALAIDPMRPMATRTLIAAVKEGQRLVIFPEGRITVTGKLMKVYEGAALIAEKADALILPVHIEGLERTPFGYLKAHQIRKALFPKVKLTILPPREIKLDPEVKGRRRRQAAGDALYQIMSDSVFLTSNNNRTIFRGVLDAAQREGAGWTALQDPVSGTLSYKRMLIGARVLGEKLMPLARQGAAVGVMLPNANGAAVTILALMSSARVVAMINFTSGAGNIISACKAAEVSTILTSRSFIEKGRLQPLVDAVSAQVKIAYLEDIRTTIGTMDKLKGLAGWKRPLVADVDPNAPAAILFTSGSEGTPKGVVLSHHNILSNASQVGARIDFGRSDKLFNVLPVFHAFGLTGGLVLPLVAGVPIYLYPSPLHYRMVPELIYSTNATIIFGTDTFLQGYARSANAYDFQSIRYVIAGAEAVKDATRKVWMEKFGLRILEGYGVTECSPVLALNTPMFSRSGTVGRLLPGIDHELHPVEGVDGGRLVVRGPNVMLGYLRTDAPGVLDRPVDGWYDTGDIVDIDAQGFVAIRGRAKRFAKVAGEMVSLAAVEALASEIWPNATTVVIARPDPRRGERLVMLTTKSDANRPDFLSAAKARGAADLMLPQAVIVVGEVPLLGSGKTDYPAVQKLVEAQES
jgi:acyl-[acyl-carrier-protein]-phospholipid O-acyltransferase/long-chain-fatty-acid--[acyl-carrier-protein] ligase